MGYNTARTGTITQMGNSLIKPPKDMLLVVIDDDTLDPIGFAIAPGNVSEADLVNDVTYLNFTDRVLEATLDANTKVYNKGYAFFITDTAELAISDGSTTAQNLTRYKIGGGNFTYTYAQYDGLTTEKGIKGQLIYVESDGGSNGDLFIVADGVTNIKDRPTNEVGAKRVNKMLYDAGTGTVPARLVADQLAIIISAVDPPLNEMVAGDLLFRTASVAAPSSFAISSTSGSTFNFTWVDNSDGEDGFQLFMSIGNNTSYALVKDNIAAESTSTSYNTGQSAGTTLYFKIRAKKTVSASTYNSAFSNEDSSTIASSFGGVSLSQSWSLYWRLDEDSANPSDSTGNNFDGVAHNNPGRVAGLETTESNAGAYQFSSAAFQAAYRDYTPANRAEVAFFFGFRKDGATDPGKFLGLSDTTLDNYIVFRANGAKLRIQKYEVDGTISTQIDSTPDAIVNDTIKTIGVILNLANGDYNIVIDGVAESGTDSSLIGDYTITNLSLGGLRYGTSWNAYADCTIDEFLFSSNVAGTISEQDLIDLHNSFSKAV